MALSICLTVGIIDQRSNQMPEKRKSTKVAWTVIAILTALIFMISGVASGASDTNQSHHIYLPFMKNGSASPSVFGVEVVGAINKNKGVDMMVQAGTSWLRYNGVDWSKIEATPGIYRWDLLDALKSQLAAYQDQQLNIIMIVRGTPAWAQEVPGSSCGPIKTSELPEFARFMGELVRQFSVPPYNIKYWEVGNEPDAPIASRDIDSPLAYGCWGRTGETNYGGEEFGEMLKAVYPTIKAADPNAKVLVGGLLLGCDPNNPPDDPNNPGQKVDCSSSRFLVGILANGNGNYFDGVSYHAYDYYYSNGTYKNGNWHADLTTGPSSIARDNYIKSVLINAGYPDKLLLTTESSLVLVASDNQCDDICKADYEKTKAAYLAVDYASAIVNNVTVRIWYTAVTAWRYSGLVTNIKTPLPAYYAFKTASTELRNAKYVKDLTSQLPNGVKGYEFTRGNRTVWLLWATTLNSTQVTFNRVPVNVYDTVGQPITPAITMSVDNNPCYFEWDGKP
jgi:hypothetical protein